MKQIPLRLRDGNSSHPRKLLKMAGSMFFQFWFELLSLAITFLCLWIVWHYGWRAYYYPDKA